ncbi:helix-turn-helix domain-containing protein [Nocardia sp. NPDC020380]|uniref:helix-turn-helix domain-containing protein n=1 Tax=Nocardia sp. NPDC020380 TaxID=3364309 RepID=UPI003794A723
MQEVEGMALELPTLAAFVRRLRIRRGWTQRQLAIEAHLGLGTIRKIEQDAPVSIGDRALTALAQALCDNTHERVHLRALAGKSDAPTGLGVTAAGLVGRVLAAFEPSPAAWLYNWRVDQANDTYRRLFPGLAEAENLPLWVFRDPRARLVLRDWHREADAVAGMLRHTATDPHVRTATAGVIKSVETVHEFRRAWESEVVYIHRPCARRRIWVPRSEQLIHLEETLIPVTAGGLLTLGVVREQAARSGRGYQEIA